MGQEEIIKTVAIIIAVVLIVGLILYSTGLIGDQVSSMTSDNAADAAADSNAAFDTLSSAGTGHLSNLN